MSFMDIDKNFKSKNLSRAFSQLYSINKSTSILRTLEFVLFNLKEEYRERVLIEEFKVCRKYRCEVSQYGRIKQFDEILREVDGGNERCVWLNDNKLIRVRDAVLSTYFSEIKTSYWYRRNGYISDHSVSNYTHLRHQKGVFALSNKEKSVIQITQSPLLVNTITFILIADKHETLKLVGWACDNIKKIIGGLIDDN